MTVEQPWVKAFERLLADLTADWGGETCAPDSRSMADLYFYPEYSCEVDSLPVRIHVSEFPGTTPGFVEAGDNVEYLRILVPRNTRYSMRVSPESFAAKIHSAVTPATELRRARPRCLFLSGEADPPRTGRGPRPPLPRRPADGGRLRRLLSPRSSHRAKILKVSSTSSSASRASSRRGTAPSTGGICSTRTRRTTSGCCRGASSRGRSRRSTPSRSSSSRPSSCSCPG